ncbi:hypothetical protein ABHA98_11790, partial [Lacticaseibacillus paracasei]|uniref:hypothetical protein n=1 Tax=Lacticaseibacillus paracasei TaxID=1597 RepID=UPI00325A6476
YPTKSDQIDLRHGFTSWLIYGSAAMMITQTRFRRINSYTSVPHDRRKTYRAQLDAFQRLHAK